MSGGRILVTGATGSIGSAATLALCEAGREVVMACRNLEKAEAVRAKILTRVPQARLEVRELDLASFASIRAFAAQFDGEPLDALFNNAGVLPRRHTLTPDGLELTFAVNYFAPFLLTGLLLSRLRPDARIVNMVSLSCRYARVDEASLRPSEQEFSQLGTYARSKLALLHFSQELARRHPALRVNVADPGIVNSEMIRLERWFDPLTDVIFRPFCNSPAKGAVPALAALEADGSGRYFVGRGSKDIPARYRDPALEKRLWEATERLL